MDRLAVLDFGGQYAHLIANRIRRLGVYSEILDPDIAADKLKGYKGIILSGGPASVYDKNAPKFDKAIFSIGKPILGICYGLQLIAYTMGGEVKPGKTKEYGIAQLKIAGSALFKGMESSEPVWMSHGDAVARLPSGFNAIGSTHDCPNAAFADDKRKIYGVQFHPEVTHTPSGMTILDNFIDICHAKREWSMKSYLKDLEQEMIAKVGDRNVIVLVSGGVDSTVCYALLEKNLGNRVYGLHIDNGFMRKDESGYVAAELKKLGFKLKVIDASQRFYAALQDVTDPEEKRKIIGMVFMEIADEHLRQLDLGDILLAQGTIYPDTIETGRTKNADVIKTHHNRVGIVQELIAQGRIIEPLQFLYKDEVRELGINLGLPEKLVNRHPFPGPGLAIRILCSDANGTIVKELDKKVDAISQQYGYSAKVLPIKSVGVQGDSRSYGHPVVVYGLLDWKKLEELSTDITNNIPEVNRTIFSVWQENGELLLKKATLTEDRTALAKEADRITMLALEKHGLMQQIWQCPTVLLPIISNGKQCVVLRPVLSMEAMTARFAPMPKEVLEKIVICMKKIGIGAVFYDITHKPPATIEWE